MIGLGSDNKNYAAVADPVCEARLRGPFVGASGTAGEPHQSQAWSDQTSEKTISQDF